MKKLLLLALFPLILLLGSCAGGYVGVSTGAYPYYGYGPVYGGPYYRTLPPYGGYHSHGGWNGYHGGYHGGYYGGHAGNWGGHYGGHHH